MVGILIACVIVERNVEAYYVSVQAYEVPFHDVAYPPPHFGLCGEQPDFTAWRKEVVG